jgi:long-chain acyl-CoA synthetase
VVLNLVAESGMSASIVDEMTPKKFLDAIQYHKITITAAVPPIFQLILNVPRWERYDCSSLKVAAMMGSVVPEQLMKEFGQRYPHLQTIQGYGATETSPLLTLTHLKDAHRKAASAGKVVPRVELKIIGRDGKELPVGQSGEIVARGPQNMKGYFKDSKATSRKIKEGWYYTGDLGWLDEEGYLYVLGRADDMVITGGLTSTPPKWRTSCSTIPKSRKPPS